MTSSHSPRSKKSPPLVLDASVAINLLGTGQPGEILRLLDTQVLMEERAYREVQRNPHDGKAGRVALDELISAGVLHLEQLSAAGFDVFLELIGADPPDDLGDGEAATIAHAMEIGGVAILDERKGRRIARLRGCDHLCTVDLFRRPALQKTLGDPVLANLIFAALQTANMRVPVEHREWVVKLIGIEQAATCSSLGKLYVI